MEDWKVGHAHLPGDEGNWFADGSKKKGGRGGWCLREEQQHKPRGPIGTPPHSSRNRNCGHTPMRMRSTELWPRQEHPHVLR